MDQPWIAKLKWMTLRRACVLVAVALIAFSIASAPVTRVGAQTGPARSAAAKREPLSKGEFSRLVSEFSEEEGNFASDNYISNETGYLTVLDKMKQLGVSGGAYLGVGPEQNFTYIAKVRPEIVFLVDIRREAIIQHLMYKAIFQMAPDRAHFLSLLFSKPLDGKNAPGRDASVEELVDYFTTAPSPPQLYKDNLAAIRKMIEKDFEIPLSEHDQRLLDHVCGAFHEANLRIFTRWSGGAGGWYGGTPTLQDLFLATDLKGKHGNFAASEADYQFLRELHRNNRIIPVVGDFAGTKALAAVGDYLKEKGYTVSAFYTSNVEQYLFGDQVFDAFAQNVHKFPVDDKSIFIRSTRGGWRPGMSYRMNTALQKMTVFLKDFDAGLYKDYMSLVTAHYINLEEP